MKMKSKRLLTIALLLLLLLGGTAYAIPYGGSYIVQHSNDGFGYAHGTGWTVIEDEVCDYIGCQGFLKTGTTTLDQNIVYKIDDINNGGMYVSGYSIYAKYTQGKHTWTVDGSTSTTWSADN